MAIDTFAPVANPDAGMPAEFNPKTISHEFGDAYKQEVTVGINPNMKSYDATWTNAKYAEAKYIINFIQNHKGAIPFYWTPNEEGTIMVFKCKKMTYKWKSGRKCDITATFEQAAAF